jgi:hypothetical protein
MEGTNRTEQNQGPITKLVVGRIFAILGLMQGIPMAVFPALGSPMFLEAVASLGTVAITFGIIGYFLGARTLGGAAVFLSMAAILIGVAMGQGMVPGIEPTDTALPAGGTLTGD